MTVSGDSKTLNKMLNASTAFLFCKLCVQHFEQDNYIDALEYIGVFENKEQN